jgi:hypothetical protein
MFRPSLAQTPSLGSGAILTGEVKTNDRIHSLNGSSFDASRHGKSGNWGQN